MNDQRMALQSMRVRNFKAIVDSRTVRFGPLTAFIGDIMSERTAATPSAAISTAACKPDGRC